RSRSSGQHVARSERNAYASGSLRPCRLCIQVKYFADDGHDMECVFREAESSPVSFAKQIKAAGHKLMTIAVVRDDEGEDEIADILSLASPGFAFRTDKDIKDIRTKFQNALCQANCFCPNGWYQLSDSFYKPTKSYGECLLLSSTPASWAAASLTCPGQAQGRGFLASEFSSMKHNFN
ncbi:Protein CLEC-63, partial [Aphelenchoides avenae]